MLKIIQWLFAIINNIGNDKKGHFLGGSILMWVLMVVWIKFQPPFLLLVGVHLFVSIGKEIIHDWWLGKGKFEVLDALYTFAPMANVWAILYALGFEVLL